MSRYCLCNMLIVDECCHLMFNVGVCGGELVFDEVSWCLMHNFVRRWRMVLSTMLGKVALVW